MMQLQDMPFLMEAVLEMCRRNGISTAGVGAVKLPTKWEDKAMLANNNAADLDGRPLKDFVPESEIDPDLADMNDLALDIMADGELTVKDILVAHTNSHALDQVLDAFYEGELAELLK
jgi:hypothetical protein